MLNRNGFAGTLRKTLLSSLIDPFAALRNRDFRIYVLGQGLSLIGTFMQATALQWLIWRITGDPVQQSIVAALTFLPVFFIAPFAGSLADRVDRRHLLIAMLIIEMVAAFILAALVAFGLSVIWPIFVLAVSLGVCMAFSHPAQAAFIGDLVGMAELRKSFGFYVSVLEAARLIGPWLAGEVVAGLGMQAAFAINGISFLAVILSLWFVRARQTRNIQHVSNPLPEFMVALNFVRSNPRIIDLILCSVSVLLFIFPVLQLSAPIADLVLRGDARTMASMMAASGGGALISAFFFAPQIMRIARAGAALVMVLIWSGFWIFVMSFVQTTPMMVLGVALYSMGIPIVLGGVNSLVQVITPADMRARVLSLMQMISFGAQPVAALLIGNLAGWLGPMAAVRINATVMLIVAFLLLTLRKEFREWVLPKAH